MKKVEYTWTETHAVFEPGDKVCASCNVDSTKPWDYIYIVERCTEPKFAGDTPTVFLQGYKQGWDATYFKLVE